MFSRFKRAFLSKNGIIGRCPGQPAVELTAYARVNRVDGVLMIPEDYMCVSLYEPLHGGAQCSELLRRNLKPKARPWKDILRERDES